MLQTGQVCAAWGGTSTKQEASEQWVTTARFVRVQASLRLTSVEQNGWESKLPKCGARTKRPVLLWCFFNILTVAVYASTDQCTSSSTSPAESFSPRMQRI